MNEQIKQRIAQLNNGEVPIGYEKTEFGIFPCDWVKDKTFGDLFDFYGGLGKSRDELGDEGHAYLHYGDLHRGAFNVVSHEQYEQLPKYDVALQGTETYLMEDGDVAFLDASEDLEGTSRAVLIDNPDNEPFIAGLHIIYGKSKEESLEKWYKQYITSSESVRKQFQRLSVGFKVYGVNRETLPKIQVAYPSSTDEQSKIAEILMKWDEAIELQLRIIERTKLRRNSIVSNIFADSDEWVSHKLCDLCKTMGGGTPSTKNELYWSGYIPWVSSSDLYEEDIHTLNISRYISDAAMENSATHLIPSNSILLVSRVGLGKLVLTDTPVCTSQDFCNLYDISCNSYFLAYYLQNTLKKIIKEAQGTSIKGLSGKEIQNIVIRLPDETLQNRIANLLKKCDDSVRLEIEKLRVLTKQRKVLHQYLLNGIVRV